VRGEASLSRAGHLGSRPVICCAPGSDNGDTARGACGASCGASCRGAGPPAVDSPQGDRTPGYATAAPSRSTLRRQEYPQRGVAGGKGFGGEDFERNFNAQRCRRFTRHLSTPRTSPPRPRVTAGWRGGLPTALCYPVERFLVRTGGSKGR
jgi:hypothetical protein